MNKIPMNLEQTVQYLLDEVQKLKAGIAPEELIPGPQGPQGERGPEPFVTISNSTGNWVIDGVDTGKPSRGKQGEKGNTGMQGVPGVGVSTMLSIDSTDYTPTVTDDGAYQDVESSADIKYSDGGVEHSTQVDFNVKVPKVDPSKTPVIEDLGHYAGLIPITSGDHEWGQVILEQSAQPYSVAQRDAGGRLKVETPVEGDDAANKRFVEEEILAVKVDSVNNLSGGTIQSSTTIKADSTKDYALTVQSNANDNGGAYEGGAYVGFKNKAGNVLGYLGIDRDKEAVLNKGGKDYKLGSPISEHVRARRMFRAQGPITLPFGSVAFIMAHDMTITWREYTGKSDTTGTIQSITTAGPCIMYLTKIGNSGVKNEEPMASGIIGYVTGDLLNPYANSSFLTRDPHSFKITGSGMLYYISGTDLGTDP